MNRNETKLLVENWRKVLDEGLYDSDPELLLTEGFLQDLTNKLGNKVTKGLTALAAIAAFKVGTAQGYPTGEKHNRAYKTVVKDLAQHFNESEESVEKYKDVVLQIAADKTLETLYYIQDSAMKGGDFETAEKIKTIFEEIKGEIKTSKKGKKYLPMEVFDRICKENPSLFNSAASAASDVPMGDAAMDTAGAKLISNTSFN